VSTDQLRLPGPRLSRPVQLPDGAGWILLGVPVAAVLGAVVPFHPEWWRALLASALVVNLVVVAMKWPRAAAVATLLWLPFLALVRRLLIDEAGWTQNDPLLLVGPLVALALCFRIFVVEKRQLAPDRLSKLVLLLLVIACFGVLNPLGTGGVIGGLAGLIFLGVPLLWFFIGRELADRRSLTGLMYAVVAVSVGIAAYGLYQTEFGSLPQWDIDWFHITGYNGSKAGATEGGTILFRPWGTFSSTSEYSGYLAIAFVFAVAMLYHRRPVLALACPLLALAVLLAGGRSVMVLTLLTVVVLTALRTRNRTLALLVVVLGLAGTYSAALAVGPRLDRAAGLSADPKIDRQAGGILHPLDPNESTFLAHWDSLLRAAGDGFTNPAGSGTGASNLGARVAGDEEVETEIDIGDVFLSFGFVGGFVFVAIILMAFRRTISRYLRGKPDPLMLAVIGALIVSFGQWLQGGHYAASPLLWFVLGWAVKPSRREVRAERDDPMGLRAAQSRLLRSRPVGRLRGDSGSSHRPRSRSGERSPPGRSSSSRSSRASRESGGSRAGPSQR